MGDIAARTIALAAGSAGILFVTALVHAPSLKDSPASALFLLGLLEFALSTLFVLVFYLVLRLTGRPHAFRVALVYALSVRFTYAVPLELFAFLFLETEHYFFALLRGIAGWLFLFAVTFILPFSYYREWRARLLSAALAIAIGCAVFYALGSALTALDTWDEPERSKVSGLGDPIGAELLSLPELTGGILPELATTIDNAVKGGDRRTSGIVLIDPDSSAKLRQQWTAARPGFVRALYRDSVRYLSRADSSAYATTRLHARDAINDIRARTALVKSLDEWVIHKERFDDAVLEYGAFVQLRLAHQRRTLKHLKVRRLLQDFYLLL